MKLYRATYIRQHKLCGMTFEARNAALAAQFAYTVVQGYIYSIGGSLIVEVQSCKVHK